MPPKPHMGEHLNLTLYLAALPRSCPLWGRPARGQLREAAPAGLIRSLIRPTRRNGARTRRQSVAPRK
jgi:hypothetical protein